MKKKANQKVLLVIALLNLVLAIFLTKLFLEDVKAGGIIEWVTVSFVLLFISPLLIVKKIFEEDVKDSFLKFDFNTKSIAYTIFIFLFFVAAIGILVLKLGWQNDLRISSWMLAEDAKLVLFIDLIALPVVIFSKEFFFRGFLLKRFLTVTNVFWAILFQAILFVVFELALGGEMVSYKNMILLLIPNIVFGFIAFKNKSVFISTIFHWVYLLILDIYFYYKFVL